MKILLVLLALLVFSVLALAAFFGAIMRAEDGEEDEDGYHPS